MENRKGGRRGRCKRPRPGSTASAEEASGDGGGGGEGGERPQPRDCGGGDAEAKAEAEVRRFRREELGEEDEEDEPLVAEDEVGAKLRVWARALERPPKGILKSYSEGLWRPDVQLCRVIKPKGNDMRQMGFGLDGDLHLYPEETLFLVERCKLEVGNVSAPQLYEAVDLHHYLAYTYFKQTSLIVIRAQPLRPLEGCEGPPIAPPPGIAFEAYAPSSNFSKTNRGRPIMYIMCGGTRAPVPTEEELQRLFAWTQGVPLKYAMISDEGGVFAVNLAPRPLENHTHTREMKAHIREMKTQATRRRKERAGAAARGETWAGNGRKGTGGDVAPPEPEPEPEEEVEEWQFW